MRPRPLNSRQAQFQAGAHISCFGEVRLAQGELEMIHPEIELIDTDDPPALPQTLTPIYPTTEGLHQLSITRILQQAIANLKSKGIAEIVIAKHRQGGVGKVDMTFLPEFTLFADMGRSESPM